VQQPSGCAFKVANIQEHTEAAHDAQRAGPPSSTCRLVSVNNWTYTRGLWYRSAGCKLCASVPVLMGVNLGRPGTFSSGSLHELPPSIAGAGHKLSIGGSSA